MCLNSACVMVQDWVALHWLVIALFSDRSIVKPADAKTPVLKDEHWQLMSDLLPVLKLLQMCWLTVLTAETGVTVSLVYPMLWGLVNNHPVISTDDSTTLSTFKTAAAEAIKIRVSITGCPFHRCLGFLKIYHSRFPGNGRARFREKMGIRKSAKL